MKFSYKNFSTSYLIKYEKILLDRWHGHFNMLNVIIKELQDAREELNGR